MQKLGDLFIVGYVRISNDYYAGNVAVMALYRPPLLDHSRTTLGLVGSPARGDIIQNFCMMIMLVIGWEISYN